MTQEEAEENFSWDRFKQVFENRYVPAEGVARLYLEFSELEQGGMTIEQYLNKFNELSRFGPELVVDTMKKNVRFIKGLQDQYRSRMTGHVKGSFVDLVDMAYRYESLENQRIREVKADESAEIPWKKNKPSGKKFSGKKAEPSQGKKRTKEEWLKSATCYNCNEKGHISTDCTKPRKIAKKEQLVKKEAPRGNECYICRQYGHWKKGCPLMKKAEVTHSYEIKELPSTSADRKGKQVL